MLDLKFRRNSQLGRLVLERQIDLLVDAESVEEKVRLLIVRDLMRLGWEMNINRNHVSIQPPDSYDKQTIRESMQIKRQQSISTNHDWIQKHTQLARENLADGQQVWNSKIEPVIEVCETQKQLDLFRIFRYYWSSPYSEYVGRRIKLIVRDNALSSKPVIGIAALGSSIIHIPERDKWVGWDTNARTNNLIYTMDAYVLGALPPYNHLLGGKLISYLITSNEVRKIYKDKYRGKITNQNKRIATDLACIFTTSLYGKSSQYNRLGFRNQQTYIPVGYTKGYGTFHLSDETFQAMRDLLDVHGQSLPNRFGDGPSWRMRVIRTAGDILGFNSDFLLKHSFRRGIYAIPLAHNFREFLVGKQKKLRYFDYSKEELVNHWQDRWLLQRKADKTIEDLVIRFESSDFSVH